MFEATKRNEAERRNKKKSLPTRREQWKSEHEQSCGFKSLICPPEKVFIFYLKHHKNGSKIHVHSCISDKRLVAGNVGGFSLLVFPTTRYLYNRDIKNSLAFIETLFEWCMVLVELRN